MKKKITIISLEEYAESQFFSIIIDDQEDSEFSKFSTKLLNNGQREELAKISYLLERLEKMVLKKDTSDQEENGQTTSGNFQITTYLNQITDYIV